MNVYPFIDAEKKSTSDGQRGGNVKRSCELLGVSRACPVDLHLRCRMMQAITISARW